ncbi:hypothetical protein EGC78_16475 [Shewanella frigidimarina]|nr:hypothetical protein EGC78_16475 [Shewanella frigidimarina]
MIFIGSPSLFTAYIEQLKNKMFSSSNVEIKEVSVEIKEVSVEIKEVSVEIKGNAYWLNYPMLLII